jgi:hypothetical protein
MPSDLETALAGLFAHLLTKTAAHDPELRQHLHQVGQALLLSTAEPAQTTVSPMAEAAVAEAPVITPAKPAVEEPARTVAAPRLAPLANVMQHPPAPVLREPREPLPELTLGRSLPPYEAPARSFPQLRSGRADFALIETRCRLKAEGCRWAQSRRRMLSDGVDFHLEIDPKDRELISRAKQVPNCYLWMNHPSGPAPSDLSLYDNVAGCFEAVADAVALVKHIEEEEGSDQTEFEAALDLLAEAQSALRMAITAIEGPMDNDQTEIFHWLKATAQERQVFIRRFMRLDDPADPTQSRALMARIEAIDSRLQDSRRRERQRKKLLGKVRHKVSIIQQNPAAAEEEWRILAASVDELITDGLPPSNRELREIVLPVIEHLPDSFEAPVNFQLVLREVDRFLASTSPVEAPVVAQPSAEVVESARLLRGRSLVLIGGDKRQGAYQALKEAFGLSDLVWIETREHESIEGFAPYVARPDVAAVVLAIRWSSHSYGEVKNFCDRHDKPLVRLPGGYNPNQVAAQIMMQCSGRLAAQVA